MENLVRIILVWCGRWDSVSYTHLDVYKRQGKRTVLAIDGPCGSGKTTLAALLARLYDCPVFHADDFFLRPEQRTPCLLYTSRCV